MKKNEMKIIDNAKLENFAVSFEHLMNMMKVAAVLADTIAYGDNDDSTEAKNNLASMMAGIIDLASLRNAELENLLKGVTNDD